MALNRYGQPRLDLSGPIQRVGPTFFEIESDRTDRRMNLTEPISDPSKKEAGPIHT